MQFFASAESPRIFAFTFYASKIMVVALGLKSSSCRFSIRALDVTALITEN